MSDHDGDHLTESLSPSPEERVVTHFRRCWRGECGIAITYLSAGALSGAITVPLSLLLGHARAEHWPAEIQVALALLSLIAVTALAMGLAVSMWRSAGRSFRLGRRFGPIVAMATVVLIVSAGAMALISGFIDGMTR
jgi:ethanolamine transporter EutH